MKRDDIWLKEKLDNIWELLFPEIVKENKIHVKLVHYMHGFSSPLPKKYRHPHKGGIVDKELIRRGFGYSLKLEKVWAKKDWEKVFALIKS